jgi:hypothetical protein
VVATLNILNEFIGLDDGYLEINSTEFDNVIDFQIMELIPCFKSFEDVIDGPFITHNEPHGLIKLNTIFKLNLLINLLLRKFLKVVLFGNFLSFWQSSTLFFILFIFIFFVSWSGRLTQIIIDSYLIIQDVETRVDLVEGTFVEVVRILALTLSVGCCIVVTHIVEADVVQGGWHLLFRIFMNFRALLTRSQQLHVISFLEHFSVAVEFVEAPKIASVCFENYSEYEVVFIIILGFCKG